MEKNERNRSLDLCKNIPVVCYVLVCNKTTSEKDTKVDCEPPKPTQTELPDVTGCHVDSQVHQLTLSIHKPPAPCNHPIFLI